MPRGPRVTQEERERILELLDQNMGCGEIARATGRSPDTISRIAAEYGHVFGATNEEKARARSAQCAALREELRLGLLSEATRLMGQLRDPHEVYSFGGMTGEMKTGTLSEPDARAKRELMTSIGIAIDKAEVIQRNTDAANSDGGKGAMLTLLESLGVKTERTSGDTTPLGMGEGE